MLTEIVVVRLRKQFSSFEEEFIVFDESIVNQLGYYVYVLIDPDSEKPFYVGKGTGNRVFQHVFCALETEVESDNYRKIREIKKRGDEVKHLILRHGLDEDVAYAVESAIIDFCLSLKKFPLMNQVVGHGSHHIGAMTTDEVIRKFRAEPLTHLGEESLIININKKFRRRAGANDIYDATKGWWRMGLKMPTAKYVLSEYRGLIVEVWEVSNWKSKMMEKTEKRNAHLRWGFEGSVAPESVRIQYLNKSVTKKFGTANPIRRNL